MEEFIDYYKVLGLNPDASQKEIKKQYHILAYKYHPDANIGKSKEEQERCEEMLKKINNAYDILSDETKKAEFDKKRKAYEEFQKEQAAKEESKQKNSTQNYSSSDYDTQDYDTSTYERRRDDDYSTPRYTRKDSEQQKRDERKVKSFSDFIDDVKRTYVEVHEEENKDEDNNFWNRHRNINKINFNYNENNFVIHLAQVGFVHICGEFIYHLKKFHLDKNDTPPRYIIKNRRSIIAFALATALITSGNKQATNTPTIADTGTSSIHLSQDYDEEYHVDDEDTITLIENYEIKAGDKLSIIAENTGTSVEDIMKKNNIRNKNVIYEGRKIKIPYTISKDDLKYYVETIEVNREDISTIANNYQTDEKTIYNLNKEAIEKIDDNTYVILSDKILVPTFPTLKEVEDLKNLNGYSR